MSPCRASYAAQVLNAIEPGDIAPQVWTIEEAAALLGVGRTTAYGAARAGQIPAIRVGRRLVVPRAALAALLRTPAQPVEDPG